MRIVQYYRCSQVVSYHIELVVFLVVVAFAICHVHRNVHLIFCFPSSFSMLSSSSSRRRRVNFLYYFCVHRIIIEFYTELCVLWFSPKKERNDFFGQIPACHKQQKKERNEYGEIHRFLSSRGILFAPLCHFPTAHMQNNI